MNLNSGVSSLGIAILQLCEIRGWSQRDLARESAVSRGRINKILKGEKPAPRSVSRIAAAFEVEEPFLWWLASVCEGSRRAYERTVHMGVEQPPAAEIVPFQAEISAASEEAFTSYHLRFSKEDPRQPHPEDRIWSAMLWSRMEKLSPEDQGLVVQVLHKDERIWALAERLCHASVEAASHRAAEAIRLAQIAVSIAHGCPGDRDSRLRMQGYCELFLANAFRVSGNFLKAVDSFVRAEDSWNEAGLDDPTSRLDPMRRLSLKASLLLYQGQSEEALALIDLALATTPEQARGRLLLERAGALEVTGRYEEAIEELRQAEPLVEDKHEPRLAWAVQLNLAVNFCHLDRYQRAELLLPRIEQLAEALGNALDSQRVLWLKGRVSAGLGRRHEAITALAAVRQHFHSQEIAYDFALVSLELATLYLEEGQTQRVKEIAEEIMAIFQSQKFHQEALAALTLFCHAANREEAEAEWTRGLIKYLYRAQHNAGLRFEP